MKGWDLVLVGLVGSPRLQDQDAVTGFRQIHRDGPTAGAGPYNDKVVFVLYAAREHRVASLALSHYRQALVAVRDRIWDGLPQANLDSFV
jgi:RES domain-containing protein